MRTQARVGRHSDVAPSAANVLRGLMYSTGATGGARYGGCAERGATAVRALPASFNSTP